MRLREWNSIKIDSVSSLFSFSSVLPLRSPPQKEFESRGPLAVGLLSFKVFEGRANTSEKTVQRLFVNDLSLMELIQSASVAVANGLAPGSGVIVNASFELGKICCQIVQILRGMEDSAAMIKTQRENIQEDVDEFKYVLGLLKRVQNQNELTEFLQQTILKFEREVDEYDCVMAKFKKKTLVKQLIFHADMDAASAKTKKTAAKLKENLSLECSVDTRNQTRTPAEDSVQRERRYKAHLDSHEVTKEMADADTQKEMLALLKLMNSHLNDPVVSVIKEKLWSSSSAAVQHEVNILPAWYITEDKVEVDEATLFSFGGDAKIYVGVLLGASETRVAVKVYNVDFRNSELVKRKFIETMNVWNSLVHNNICRFYGAWYLSTAPAAVMELCEKGPLNTFLRRDKNENRRAELAIDLLLQAANGIA